MQNLAKPSSELITAIDFSFWTVQIIITTRSLNYREDNLILHLAKLRRRTMLPIQSALCIQLPPVTLSWPVSAWAAAGTGTGTGTGKRQTGMRKPIQAQRQGFETRRREESGS